jgi:hypothetical protein
VLKIWGEWGREFQLFCVCFFEGGAYRERRSPILNKFFFLFVSKTTGFTVYDRVRNAYKIGRGRSRLRSPV